MWSGLSRFLERSKMISSKRCWIPHSITSFYVSLCIGVSENFHMSYWKNLNTNGTLIFKNSNTLDHNNNKQIGSTLKLQSINSAAKLLHPDYKGPHLNMADDALLRKRHDNRISIVNTNFNYCRSHYQTSAKLGYEQNLVSPYN